MAGYIPSWGQGLNMNNADIDSLMLGINTDYSSKINESVMGNTPSSLNFEPDKRGFFDTSNSATGEKTQGWGMPAIQGVGALANAYLGYQQLQLGKSQLAQNKKIFNLNFGAQAQTLNTQMEDRQRARVASAGSGSGSLDSVDSYMAKNAIKTKGI